MSEQDYSNHTAVSIPDNQAYDGQGGSTEVVTVNGIQMPVAAARQHGLITQNDTPASVAQREAAPDPRMMHPDGVTHAVVAAAGAEVRHLMTNMDQGEIANFDADFYNGEPAAEDFIERMAPNAMAQGYARADTWCEALDVETDMLSTDLVDQHHKAQMLQAIRNGDQHKFNMAVAESKNSLHRDLAQQGFQELNGVWSDVTVTADGMAHYQGQNIGPVVDRIFDGTLEI